MKNEKDRLLTLIDTLEKTIRAKEGRTIMSIEEKFKGFTYQDSEKYKKEAMDKYGKEVIEESVNRQKDNEKEVVDGFNNIFFAFAENHSNGIEATAKENVEIAEKLHKHLCKWSFDCSLEALSGIGYGYAKNPEFKKNIDQFGEGTSQYACDAIQQYVSEERR